MEEKKVEKLNFECFDVYGCKHSLEKWFEIRFEFQIKNIDFSKQYSPEATVQYIESSRLYYEKKSPAALASDLRNLANQLERLKLLTIEDIFRSNVNKK